MTDLLPVIFARGQNESIDPRVAPIEAHSVAQNVRWRKDGRPAKRYGVTALTTTGLAPGSFNTQPVNAITSWNKNPVIAVGSRVSQLSPTLGWSAQLQADDGELSHFGPGKRDIIVRDERNGASHQSCATAGGLVLHAWDSGGNTYYTVKGVNGETIVTPRLLLSSVTWPRCISTTNFIYILTKNPATGVLDLRVFDPTTLAVTAGGSPGTLDAGTSHYDAIGRSGDFIVAYQSGVNVITVKSFAAVLVPINTQTRTTFAAATGAWLGVGGTNTSNVFVCVVSVPTGTVGFDVFNNTMTAGLGGVAIEIDANNNGMPGVVIESNTIAQFVWCGFIAATSSSYMRSVRVSAGVVLGTIATYANVTPASKPFMGPLFATLGNTDGAYIWVATHNADNGSTKWDTQRAYYLMKFRAVGTFALRRQMHLPNVTPDVSCQQHLGDALALGAGYGFFTSLLNAVRFTAGGITSLCGVDSVSARSIYESTKMAARDSVMAGRVLQFSGGSLFELNGTAEETGFSNAPVIIGFALAGGGGIANGTYIYRAVYEWLDNQGRRHRSAPSDPITVANGANTQVILAITTMIADAHTLNASGTSAGRGTVVHVYRTLNGQSTFHRVTPDTGAPQASVLGGTATVNFNDIYSDANIAANEFIYTDGGVQPNTLCPPHTFMTVCQGRVWVAGQLDGSVLTASKLLVEGEPTQFSDLAPFSVFLPTECTGVASIDGTVVAFSEDRIYFVTGDGPDDQGVGSFSPPTELPTDVGCVDWRSVVETSLGVFFLSKRGIYLLPRGFNTPLFVGAEVEQTLASYPKIVSATLVAISSNDQNSLGEITVRFVVGSDDVPSTTCVLVYDLRTGGWSVDDIGSGPLLSGTWSDAFITSRMSAGALTLQSESAASGGYADFTGSFVPTKLGTGDIRPFGLAGYGNFKTVMIVGEYRGNCQVNVAVSVDGQAADTFPFVVSSADAPDGSVYLAVTPKIQLGSAIRITCSDVAGPFGPASEGFVMQALFIESETIGKTKRLATARRA